MSPPGGSISAIEFGVIAAPSTAMELPPPMPTPVLVNSATLKAWLLAIWAIEISLETLLKSIDRAVEVERGPARREVHLAVPDRDRRIGFAPGRGKADVNRTTGAVGAIRQDERTFEQQADGSDLNRRLGQQLASLQLFRGQQSAGPFR